jgi:hypothetical protein
LRKENGKPRRTVPQPKSPIRFGRFARIRATTNRPRIDMPSAPPLPAAPQRDPAVRNIPVSSNGAVPFHLKGSPGMSTFDLRSCMRRRTAGIALVAFSPAALRIG